LQLGPRMPTLAPLRNARLAVLARSLVAGGLATFADLGTLVAAMSLFGLPARAANVPALLVGGAVNFVGNRHFAFRATRGSLRRQAVLYALTEAVALGLNGILFASLAPLLPPSPGAAAIARLVTSNVVFLAWSWPVWRRVFSDG
jgi:putative flippase GtrA